MACDDLHLHTCIDLHPHIWPGPNVVYLHVVRLYNMNVYKVFLF